MTYEIEVSNHPEISEEESCILWGYSAKTERASVKGVIALPYAKDTLTVALKSVMEQLAIMFPPPEGVILCPWLIPPPIPPEEVPATVAVNWPAVTEEKPAKKVKAKKVAPEVFKFKEETPEDPFTDFPAAVTETEADFDSGQKLRVDETLYIKGDPKQKEDCLKLIEKLSGVTRAEIPRYPEIGGAASRCLISMVNDEMIFYREGAVSKEVADLFAANIPNVKGA
jgi:hypothetical protein